MMARFTRIGLGYHGGGPAFADALIRGDMRIEGWPFRRHPYDWLGHGLSFGEFPPHRARLWAGKGGVVGAVSPLGLCLDLTDVHHTELLREEY